MKNKIQQENLYISTILLSVFVTDKILDYDGSLDSLKLNENEEINFIYRPEILEDYIYVVSNFFQNLPKEKDLEVDDLKSFVQSLFEEHLECFILTLRKMLKNDTVSFNDLDFIMKFTGTYFSKFLPKDYILERIVFKFNDDNSLRKYSFLKPYFNNTVIPETDFDANIFKNKEGYLIFKDYVDGHIIDELNDYSYIFQNLLKDNFIYKITHTDFLDWMKNNKHISDKGFIVIQNNSGFRSLSKCKHSNRLNHYLKIKEKYLK